MAELKLEEAKKELGDLVNRQKSALEKSKESQMTDEQKKLAESEKQKAEKLRQEKEIQAKKDAELLSKKEEEITDEADKKRRSELLEQKRKEEESKLSSDEKIKKIKDESQKRIDEIANELKQSKDLSSKEIQELRKEMELIKKRNEELEKGIKPKDEDDEIASLIEKEEKERIEKYLQDDKNLPREKRREMPEEDLEEWLLEDLKAATAWLSRREHRRLNEKNESKMDASQKKLVEKIFNKQIESSNRVKIKHPELDVSKREEELKSQGKSGKEVQKILCEENEKYRIFSEIFKEDSNKYWVMENAPEVIMAEMEKRLSKDSSGKSKEVEELTKKVEELTAELAKLKDTDYGVNSTLQRKKEEEEKLTEMEQNLVKTMEDLNLPQTKIDSALKKFREQHKK